MELIVKDRPQAQPNPRLVLLLDEVLHHDGRLWNESHRWAYERPWWHSRLRPDASRSMDATRVALARQTHRKRTRRDDGTGLDEEPRSNRNRHQPELDPGNTELMRADLIDLTPALGVVLDRLIDAGGRPMIVGGSVRDALLGIRSADIDIECYSISYGELADTLSEVGRVDLVGASFGVLKYWANGLDVDVSLPRRDNRIGVGHRGFEIEVDHTLSFVEASARRDFTINAIGWDPATGELHDPHSGRSDLESRVLRHVSDAFGEDPLRVLRGVQFAGRFDMTFDPGTAELCRSMFDAFNHLPVERVWETRQHGSAPVTVASGDA